jgi:ubiquinone/menaquinone biosynthesis C-methylase UbiE
MRETKTYDFNQEADTYDDFYTSAYGEAVDRAEKRVIQKYITRLEPAKVLELGCGTGHWTQWFASFGFEVVGLDIAEKMLDKARQRGLDNATFISGDMMKLPFADHSFEHVFSVAAFSFTTNPRKALLEAIRVLKPGGKLIAAVLNQDSIIGEMKANNETFKLAQFFTEEMLIESLSGYGDLVIDRAAHITSSLEVLDQNGCYEGKDIQAAMLIAVLTKA